MIELGLIAASDAIAKYKSPAWESQTTSFMPFHDISKLASTGTGAALTVSDNVADACPAEFEAITVYVVREDAAVGVPVMTPVAAERANPGGSAGLTVYWVTVPTTLGDSGDIAVPTTKTPGSAY